MAETVRILHTADLHLGASLSFLGGTKRATRKAELLLCLDRLFSLCRTNEIPLLILSGDVFDSNAVDTDIVTAFLSSVKNNGQVRVVFAAGNHDPLTSDSPFLNNSLPENLTVLGTDDTCVYFEDINTRVYGKSFKSVYMAASERFSITPPGDNVINIMVLHGDLGSDTVSPYNSISQEFLRNSGMDYVALGHIHTFSGVKQTDSVYYAYPGCPEPHGFDESGNAGVICAEVGKNYLKHRFVPTAARTHETVNIDISAATDNETAASVILDELKSRFGENYGKNLYKIILTGGLSEEVRINTAEIKARLDNEVFYLKIKNCTHIDTDLSVLAHENTLKGKFVKIMLEKINAEPQNAEKLKTALGIGLKAFRSEVKLDEN